MRCPLFYLLLLLSLCAQRVAAQDGGAQLLNLPLQAQVYVDGQLVSPQDGKLQIAVGQHELQIEGLSGDSVVAYRRRLIIETNQTLTIHLVCAPVYIAPSLDTNGRPSFPAGADGPPGVPGPPGLAPDNTALSRDFAALPLLFEGEIRTQLHDLERRAALLSERTNETKRGFYWYDAKAGSMPAGPTGEPGDHGVPGTPGNVVIIQDETGQPLLPQLLMQLGIAPTATTLQDLEARAYRRPSPVQTSGVWALPLTLLTSAFSKHLEKLRQGAMDALASSLRETPLGPEGDKGPIGPRGPAWQPSPGELIKPVRLNKAQAQQIIASLTADKNFKERVAALQQQEQYLATWVAEREKRE